MKAMPLEELDDLTDEEVDDLTIRSRQRPLFFVLAMSMCVHFGMSYALRVPSAFGGLHNFAYGPLDVPYRPRILMRWVYRFAYMLTKDRPPHIAHGAMTAEQITLFCIATIAMAAVVYLTRASIGVLVGKNAPVRWLALLTVYMCCYHYVLTPEMPVQFPYDVPGVAVFAVCLYAILTDMRWLYYPTFILGTFNRETTMFLPPIFVLLALDQTVPFWAALKRLSAWRYMEAGLQLVAWAGIVHWCNVTTNAVLGPSYQLSRGIKFLMMPPHWPTLLSVYAFLWAPYLLFFRRIGHVNLQRCAILLPFWFAAMMWKADLLEIRVQSEWIPYLAICLALIVHNSFFAARKAHLLTTCS